LIKVVDKVHSTPLVKAYTTNTFQSLVRSTKSCLVSTIYEKTFHPTNGE